jgi:hypothetical protein
MFESNELNFKKPEEGKEDQGETDFEGLTKEQAMKKYRAGFELEKRIVLKEIEGKKVWYIPDENKSLKEWDEMYRKLDEEDDSYKSYRNPYSD